MDICAKILEGKDSRCPVSRRYLIVMFTPEQPPRSISIPLPPNKCVVFISDVHLGLGPKIEDQHRERALVRLLQQVAVRAHHVFIVGDLFDFWFDWGTVIPKQHFRTLAAIAELLEGGVGVTYLMGNHDFGHHRFFREELGLTVDAGDVDVVIGKKRFYVSHGDGKANNDAGYRVLKSVLRNPVAQWLYRAIHPDWAVRLASATSKGSRDHTGKKDYGEGDGLREFAARKIHSGYDFVIMGHRHKATVEHFDHGIYVNIGHWLGSEATYVEYSEHDGLRLLTVP